ncbi:S-adenosyl-L-methionine-dependent tRNA 4-demethylwyosine synthase [Entophlyctis luteolus]|nr:S-adenosyl-L-methionine-dependent tRNA 4-demethylwyosine synthase [Entophlyctis luteolus]
MTVSVSVIFSTQEGTTETFAEKLASRIRDQCPSADVVVVPIKALDNDDLLKRASTEVVFFTLTTYIDGGPADDASWFASWLEDYRFDFRVSKDSLSNLRYSVFGVGDAAYGRSWCLFPKKVDGYLQDLAGKRVCESIFGDVGDRTEFDGLLESWIGKCANSVSNLISGNDVIVGQVNNVAAGDELEISEDMSDDDESLYEDAKQSQLMDLEDLGSFASTGLKEAKSKDEDDSGIVIRKKGAALNFTREMITPNLRKNLEKQGYKLIGTHSGVKMCRWTKAQLRNRGGCYKHTFYGIESHRCMETTPSLACANKCVFCWRHQTNPVGVEWRWKADLPEDIVNGAIEKHRAMIKQMKGVPGVTPEKFNEGMDIAHCALSLVGEPIMYPYINEFVDLLHSKSISSFLLYLSVDAGNKESLKKIDRPLFSDFWERFNACLDELAKKEQRTVFRMTLVKGFNIEELKNYADLIRQGKPDFVEVKGVTFCGYTGENSLTMSNVPFHEEVVEFVKLLANEISDDYEIACEHAHTCSMLIAHKRYKINGVWHTWIDYPEFHRLARLGKPFTSMDYVAQTPDWAVFGDDRKGFDPEMTRVYKSKAKYDGNPEAYKEKIKLQVLAGESNSPHRMGEDFLAADSTAPAEDAKLASFPDGGFAAWIIVFGSFVAHFVVYGAVYSFGIYNSYYAELRIGSAFEIAMIGSVGAGVIDGIGILSGILSERIGCRPMLLIGSVILFIGLFASSFTTSVPLLILTQGSVSLATARIQSVKFQGSYMELNRGFATGISVAGTGFGGLFFSAVTPVMIESIGLAWSLRCTAIISFLCMMIVTPFMRTRLESTRSKADFSFLKMKAFYFLLLACFFANFVMFIPLDFLPVFAQQEMNLSLSDQSTVMIVYNACNIVGRVVMGFASDRFLGPLNSLALSMWITVASVFWWLGVARFGELLAFGAVNGFFDGAFWGLFPVVVAHLFGADASLATMLATLYTLLAVGNFGSPPLAGFIEQTYGLRWMIVYAGAVSVLAALFGVAARYAVAGNVWLKKI